ncbi:MAG: polysaccharide biosynthesis protein [Clostridia bacterium]|nr:polysaccharide biosynthesis protein [Clostridia bacterium]
MGLQNKRRLTLIFIDFGIMACVYTFAFFLMLLAGAANQDELLKYFLSLLLFAACMFGARLLLRVYSNVWRYANAKAYLGIVIADVLGGIIALFISIFIKYIFLGGWHSVAIVAMMTTATLVSRFVYQRIHKSASKDKGDGVNKITVAIIGAGQVGALLAEELLYFRGSHYRPVMFVDKSRDKVGSRVEGIPVYAETDDVFEIMHSYGVQEIFIAIPQLTSDRAREMFEYYSQSGCKVKLYDFAIGAEHGSMESDKRVIREFNIEDLLFRSSIEVLDGASRDFYRDKVVLITGGGGSIGSELARQVAKCSPKHLIIFDIYENNAYDIEQELLRRYKGEVKLSVEIGSVRDPARLDAVFSNYRPDIVFHAAAHKHVPLMEHSNSEAIKNNVLGTYNTANAAEKWGAERFILISTDKAVNPTNVMGASKRMCEMVVQCRRDSDTVFSAVRFGNVLGSNGSVIPLFKRQIAAGGPVTVTDKRIIRYFMTIPEASGLVMQAGAMARCGELFVLDMGKPVKIYDLAENVIKLSGLRPYIDIEIVETGLRPGEKLYEELLIRTEELEKTENNLIFIEHDTPLSRTEIEEKLKILRTAVKDAEGEIGALSITEAMKMVVPTFHSPDEVNRTAEDAEEMKSINTARR